MGIEGGEEMKPLRVGGYQGAAKRPSSSRPRRAAGRKRKSAEFVLPLRYSFRDNTPKYPVVAAPHSRRFISTFA